MARNVPADIIPFDRFWRAGHPMRPQTSSPRRWCMLSMLLMLLAVISAYAYLTNSNRVRAMAESYLSQLIGGQVTVHRATLNVFEGLRLDDVRVRLAGESAEAPPIFSADTFVVRYSLRKLLTGRIEATQIVARRPHVQLTQDIDSLVQSYRRMMRDGPNLSSPRMTANATPPPLPEIKLRDAQIDYRETHADGTTSVGTLSLEGQFTPVEDADRYEFSLQSRGMSEQMGPNVVGSIYPRAGRVTAQLHDFELGRDIRLMLPAPVRQWWEQHELAGRVDITEMSYSLPRGQSNSKFLVRVVPQGGTFLIRPGEMMSSDESNRVASVRDSIDTMAAFYRAAGYSGAGPWQPVESLFTSAPLKLDRLSGTLVFTETGIVAENIQGNIEGNRVYIDGQVDGYPGRAGVPEPPMRFRVTSGGKALTLPPSPGYTNALPHAVREIYDQLRPYGQCKLAVSIDRQTPGGKLQVAGTLDVLDGNFVFLRFPYPVRNATGAITFARADASGPERLEINLKGLGIAGGPNANTTVTVNGIVAPLGNDAGVSIRVASDSVHNEDALALAFPYDVQRTFKLFDAEGKGRYPIFHGSFACDVHRPVGPRQNWNIFTQVKVDKATGSLVAFPYLLENLAMELKVGNNYVEVINAHTTRGEASIRVDGNVSWAPEVPVRIGETSTVVRSGMTTITTMKVHGNKVPIDRDLLAALPEDRRSWLKNLGVSGTLDFDGTVRSDTRLHTTESPAGSSKPVLDFDIDASLSNGTLWPQQGAFVLSDVQGKMHLQPDRIDLKGIKGRRADATFSVDGSIDVTPDGPIADLQINANNLPMDAALYSQMRRNAKQAWDQIRPVGTADVDLTLKGPLRTLEEKPSEDTAILEPLRPVVPVADDKKLRKTAIIRPRELSVFPKFFPYKLDHVTGRIVVEEDKVTLHQVTAKHGDGVLSAWGSGTVVNGRQDWNLTLFARDVTADSVFVNAMPKGFANWLTSMKIGGKLGWYVPKFNVQMSPAVAGSQNDVDNVDLQVNGKITFADATFDVGVPIAKLGGSVSGSVEVKAGKLSEVHGTMDYDAFTIAERPAKDFHAGINRDAGSDILRIDRMRAELAGGDMAGDVTVVSPETGPGTFSLNLVLRDADAGAIAMTDKDDIKGRLSASLGLEGTFDAPETRRGRGDVLVNGKNIYSLPVVMGLLQITNLALPVSTPVTEASTRYSVDGQRVTFDNISLRSDTMVMQGEGHLDFDTKKVALTFTTDNPNAIRIPFLTDLWRNAQQELFKIEVRGTVQEPKVSAAALNTVTTTVDEVFNPHKR